MANENPAHVLHRAAGTYLAAVPGLAKIVQRVAFYRAIDKDLDHAAMRMKRDFRIVKAINRRGLDLIAAELRRHRVEVF